MNNSNFKHVGGKQLDNVRMILKLSIADPAAEGILECALRSHPEWVEYIIEKGQLYQLPANDRGWWALLSSLHSNAQWNEEYGNGGYPDYFRDWALTYYPGMDEYDLEDLTVFGSRSHASIFDGQRNIHVEF